MSFTDMLIGGIITELIIIFYLRFREDAILRKKLVSSLNEEQLKMFKEYVGEK